MYRLWFESHREGEVKNTAVFGLAVTIKTFNIHIPMPSHFHFLVSMLEQWFLNFSEHENYLENLGQISGLLFWTFSRCGLSLRICISNKFPDDAVF